MKSPAFQFYPDDFLGSGKVGTMTVDEVGAYTLLLCLDWNETGFVFDEEELARWCRMSRAKFRKAWARVSRCFEERGGRMFNPRLEKEREKQALWREKSAEGGRASAQARAKGGSKGGSGVVEPPNTPKSNTPVSSLQSPVTTQLPANAGAATPPAIVRTKRSRATQPPAPFMGRLNGTWKQHLGGDLPPGSATLLRPVVADVGEEEADKRLDAYLDSTDPEYVSVRSFAAKHGAYGDDGPLVDPATGLLNAAGLRVAGGRA